VPPTGGCLAPPYNTVSGRLRPDSCGHATARIPELASDREAQLAVMKATIATWQSDYTQANGTGAIDLAAWDRSIAFMSGLPDSPVARPVTAAECVDATFAAR